MNQPQTKHCTKCGIEKSIDSFYWRNQKRAKTSHCKKCLGKLTVATQRQAKERAIEYKGGKCEKCGYDKCHAALEFHHLDPNEKDFAISKSRFTVFDNIKKELDKCILVCANCHREIHFAPQPTGGRMPSYKRP